ncbi:hypothetical protein BCR42DRAFT_419468 [Absidia repens]|uniref:Uncharacterized protein n=1 Tax=Absidia repens TaxID=90262 RepID=A0A1X2IBG4_9FUNG|nr:hypothetical protein BCR42DRAFT_419468 [Absidia repens]
MNTSPLPNHKVTPYMSSGTIDGIFVVACYTLWIIAISWNVVGGYLVDTIYY